MIPKKLSMKEFLRSFKLAPRIAIDLWIKNEDGAVLYFIRQSEPYLGYWHIPGGFLLVGEAVHECIERIAREEVGLETNGKSPRFLRLDEDLKESRGHVVHIVYSVMVNREAIKENAERKFLFKPPDKLIPSHRHIFLNVS